MAAESEADRPARSSAHRQADRRLAGHDEAMGRVAEGRAAPVERAAPERSPWSPGGNGPEPEEAAGRSTGRPPERGTVTEQGYRRQIPGAGKREAAL